MESSRHNFIFDQDNKKVALKIAETDIKPGLSFFSEEDDFLQVGTWRYEKAKKLPAHIHNYVPRQSSRTQEFVFVVKGIMKAFVYDDREQLLAEVILKAHEGLLLFCGAHGYEICEEDTIIVEVKNGPYPGAEADRRRIG